MSSLFSFRSPGLRRRVFELAVLSTFAVAFFGLSQPAMGMQDVQSKKLRKLQRQFTDQIRPILESHCGDCHWGDSSDADLNLEAYETIEQVLAGRKKWKKVLVRTAAREMPPEDCEPIPDDEHKKLLNWTETMLNSVDCTNINPGRVTIRRLNRTEYKNTIRDLTGVTYKTDGNFPADDVGYGFDNIADVLSLSPILMEKYLKASEEISREAIDDPGNFRLSKSLRGKDFATQNGNSVQAGRLSFGSNSTASTKINVLEKGRYRVRILATADQAGTEKAKFQIDIDGRQKKVLTVTKSRPDQDELVVDFGVAKTGTLTLNVTFLNDYWNPPADRNLMISGLTFEGPTNVRSDSYKKIVAGKTTDSAEKNRKLAKKSVSIFGSRAYRRPIKSDEVDRLMELYDAATKAGDSFDQAIRYPVQAILVSPHFLYKIEQPPAVGEIRELNDFELATSLSYFLWSSMPDGQLFKAASQGKLKDPAVFRQQISRMLKDKRARAVVQNFASQWLQLRSLARVQPDQDMFPGVNKQLRQDMATETKLLVYDLIRNDAQVMDLLKADYTFLNERLAKHYGVEGVSGNKFQKVSATKTRREGLLSHGSILTLTSNPNRTSPVKRGKWIMENLLGEEPPPPDPDAMQLEDQPKLTGTLRQRMEQHRADPSCAVCHKVMDELGFALEGFDPVGRFRQRDETGEIDARCELPDGTKFLGSKELQVTIRTAMRNKFVRCLSEKMLIYAIGRGLEYYDECTVDQITARLKKKEFRFSELIASVCESDPFRKRYGEGASRSGESQE